MMMKRELQQYIVEFVAEAFATFILLLFNGGAIANFKFSHLTLYPALTLYLGVGVGVYTALMAAGSITGAHINPAVSIPLMTIRKIKPIQCIFYVLGQLLGAFLGGAVVYFVYWSQINNLDGGIRQVAGPNGTANIFFTMPSEGIPHWNAFLDQVVSTGLLLIFIMSLDQNFNHLISDVNKPFALILIVMGLNCAYSVNAGAALNPARDFGPRLFCGFVYGWKNVFSANDYYFWIPIFGPILGGIIGVWIYQCYSLMIKNYGHYPRNEYEDLARIVNTETDISEIRRQHIITTD